MDESGDGEGEAEEVRLPCRRAEPTYPGRAESGGACAVLLVSERGQVSALRRVKHRFVAAPEDWPYSSYRRDRAMGRDW